MYVVLFVIMNIVSFIISLFTALLSFMQGGCGNVLSGTLHKMSECVSNNLGAEDFTALGSTGLLVMLASLIGLIGGSLALGRKKSAHVYLFVSAAMCGLAFFAGFKDADVYGFLYVVSAFFALTGSIARNAK